MAELLVHAKICKSRASFNLLILLVFARSPGVSHATCEWRFAFCNAICRNFKLPEKPVG